MLWEERPDRLEEKFSRVSGNQHGARYIRNGSQCFATGRLTANKYDADDMQILILISQLLRVPVEFDFDKTRAYIDIAAIKSIGGE